MIASPGSKLISSVSAAWPHAEAVWLWCHRIQAPRRQRHAVRLHVYGEQHWLLHGTYWLLHGTHLTRQQRALKSRGQLLDARCLCSRHRRTRTTGFETCRCRAAPSRHSTQVSLRCATPVSAWFRRPSIPSVTKHIISLFYFPSQFAWTVGCT